MRFYVAVAFFSCALTAVLAGRCADQESCLAGQCCAGLPFFGGICRALTPVGGKCKVVDKILPIFGDFYIGSCPCAEGLVCVQQGKKKNNGVCQPPPTTAAPEVPVTTAAPEVPEVPASSAEPEVPEVPASSAAPEVPAS
ncbi:prokineticin domain-containing protein [Trichonephila clavipes]|nr:prokineticin domain-containing protein [Trichonephila clavipes]